MESITMLSGEMNARMSREKETMMDVMHTHISRAISSAISERIIPELENMVEHLPLSQRGVEPCTSINEDGVENVWKNANTKLAKKDSRSACVLRDHTDTVPYTVFFVKMRVLSIEFIRKKFGKSVSFWLFSIVKSYRSFWISIFKLRQKTEKEL